ncbi:MAG: endo-1,4-beta-xylanase [Terracidiphilus sp.]
MTKITRREAMLMSLEAAACGLVGKRAAAWAAEKPSFKSIGGQFNYLVGIQEPFSMLQNPTIAQIVVQQFNLLTASGMKWDAIHPTPEKYDFREADWNVQFAQEHGMKIHGHNLCWDNPEGNPPWFKTALNKSNARQILTSHITTVMKRYKGKIESWDVVNEPIVPWPGRSDGLYPGVWVDLLGPEYLDIAFYTAKDADPNALRVMNVHHVEQGTPDAELNRQRVISWLERLVHRGTPVQAVGMESHLDTSQPLAGEQTRQFVEKIRGLGLQVLITELDVKETRATGNSHDWDVHVADYYREYLGNVLSAVQPHAVIFWSLIDRWEGNRKVQGLLQNNLSPRLSLTAAEQALESAPRRG